MALLDLMSRPLVTVTPDTRVEDALQTARDHHVHHLVVLAGDQLAGILCVCDVHRGGPADPISSCMNTTVRTISVNETLEGAARTMRATGFGCLPVVAGALLLGVITADDLVRAGFSLEDLGRRTCASCGSSLHVRPTRRDPDVELCLYCRERAAESPDNLDLGDAD
jgi:acetoin utilization protein AcuB